MDIKGKITIFPKKVKVEEKDEIMCFNGTLTTKEGEGDNVRYLNKSVEVRFAKKQFPQEKLLKMKEDECYQLEVEDGFLGVKEVRLKDRIFNDIYIQVLKGTLKGHKPVTKREQEIKDDDLPF